MAWEVLHKEAVATARLHACDRIDALVRETPVEMDDVRRKAKKLWADVEKSETLVEMRRALKNIEALRQEVVRRVRKSTIKQLQTVVDSLPLNMDGTRADVYVMLGDIDLQDTVEDVNRLAQEVREYIVVSRTLDRLKVSTSTLDDNDEGGFGGEAVPVRK